MIMRNCAAAFGLLAIVSALLDRSDPYLLVGLGIITALLSLDPRVR